MFSQENIVYASLFTVKESSTNPQHVMVINSEAGPFLTATPCFALAFPPAVSFERLSLTHGCP